MNRPRKDQPVQFRLDDSSPWQSGVYVARVPGPEADGPDARCRVFADDGTLLKVRCADIRWRTLTDDLINQYALFFAANPGDTVPEVNLGGDEDGESAVMVRAYADEGVLVISVDTTCASPDDNGGGPWTYYDGDQVPVVVNVNGPRVWMALPGANRGAETIGQAVYDAYVNGWKDRGHFRGFPSADDTDELAELSRLAIAWHGEARDLRTLRDGDDRPEADRDRAIADDLDERASDIEAILGLRRSAEPVVFAEIPVDPGHIHGSDVGPGRPDSALVEAAREGQALNAPIQVKYADLPDTPAWLAYAGVPLELVPEALRESVRAHREAEGGN